MRLDWLCISDTPRPVSVWLGEWCFVGAAVATGHGRVPPIRRGVSHHIFPLSSTTYIRLLHPTGPPRPWKATMLPRFAPLPAVAIGSITMSKTKRNTETITVRRHGPFFVLRTHKRISARKGPHNAKHQSQIWTDICLCLSSNINNQEPWLVLWRLFICTWRTRRWQCFTGNHHRKDDINDIPCSLLWLSCYWIIYLAFFLDGI